jgi:hypothetical protein
MTFTTMNALARSSEHSGKLISLGHVENISALYENRKLFSFSKKKPKMGTYLSNRLFLKTRLLHTLKFYVLIVNSS